MAGFGWDHRRKFRSWELCFGVGSGELESGVGDVWTMAQVATGGPGGLASVAGIGMRRLEDDHVVRQASDESWCSSSSESGLSGNPRPDWNRSNLSLPQGKRLHTIASGVALDEVAPPSQTPVVASSKRTTVSPGSHGEPSMPPIHPGQFALPPIPHIEPAASGDENRSHRSLLSHYSIDAGKHGFMNYAALSNQLKNSKRESFDEDESDDDFSQRSGHSGHDSLVFKYQPGQQTPPAYYELPEQICNVYESKRATAQETEFAVPTLSLPHLQLLPYHERKRLMGMRQAEPPSEITPLNAERTKVPEQSCNRGKPEKKRNWFGRLIDTATGNDDKARDFRNKGQTFLNKTEEERIRLREQSKREEIESLVKPSGRGAKASSLSNALESIASYSDDEETGSSSSTSCEGDEEQGRDDTAARKKRYSPKGHDRRMTRERIQIETYESQIRALEKEKERLSRKFRVFVLVTVATIFVAALGFAMFVCVRILMSM